MFRIQALILSAAFLLLAACTTTAEPEANPITVTRPTVVPVSETPLPTLTTEPTATTQISPTLYTLPPTETTTSAPQSFYENVWVGGLLMSHTQLRVANSSIPNVLVHTPMITLQTADPETAERLNSLPTPEVLVMAQGDFHYNGPEDYQLVVESIELVNLPYSAETPLDAIYHHTDPEFSFDYPSGWFIRPIANEEEGILRLNNVPPIIYEQGLLIGMEYSDPTQYDLTVRLPDADSIEEYVDAYDEPDPSDWEVEMLELNGRPAAKITVYGLGTTVIYVVELNGIVLTFYDWMPQIDFMERIIATVR